ncbi:MAG: 2-phospho-L-lactate transferase, partial [Acidimicrobiia bacterium]|nr:2-phospho-L-lactate transferase [Acidimicrobiia bacterium]
VPVVPATDDRLRTIIHTSDGSRLEFQDYFVVRRHADSVADVVFEGATAATPAPGVIEALASAGTVVIAPSNPPLSIWPILAVPGIRDAVAAHPNVVAVSPLFGGRALKGPAAAVMETLGLGTGTPAVLAAYAGLIRTLVVDETDRRDVSMSTDDVEVVAASTDLSDGGAAFAEWLLERYA